MRSCAKCGGGMRRGFVLDNTDQAAFKQACWVAGEPVKSFWTGLKVPKDAMIPIVTLRCDRCGFLESYAAEISGA